MAKQAKPKKDWREERRAQLDDSYRTKFRRYIPYTYEEVKRHVESAKK